MQRFLSLMLTLALLLAGCGQPTKEPQNLRAKELAIDLGDGFTAKAVLTYPAEGEGPWPTVILFHGSGPYDMNATVTTPTGKPLSANFKRLAERLSQEGAAVLRFHKRGVEAYGKYDREQIARATTNQLIVDAGRVIAAARQQPEVDANRIYLYGWSQGAQVATHAAQADGAIAGLILQGPPTSGWSETLRYQHLTLGLPLLASEAIDADQDGKLAVKEWFSVPAGPASLMGSFYVWAMDSTPMKPKLRPELDRNDDKQVDLEGELRPAIEALVANPAANPSLDPASEPARSIAQVLPDLSLPVLVLHGEQDGWVPVTDGEQVAAAAPERLTLKRFPGLGHALSPTIDPAQDSFGPMADEPIQALIDWLAQR